MSKPTLRVYTRHSKDGKFYIYISPFRLVGIGDTPLKSRTQAEELLSSHFEGLAEAIRTHGLGH